MVVTGHHLYGCRTESSKFQFHYCPDTGSSRVLVLQQIQQRKPGNLHGVDVLSLFVGVWAHLIDFNIPLGCGLIPALSNNFHCPFDSFECCPQCFLKMLDFPLAMPLFGFLRP